MKDKSRNDRLFASSFRGPVPRGRAGKEYHSTPCRRSSTQPDCLGANKCCATHPAPTCTMQSGQLTPAFLCHRNLVKFRDIEYVLNFQLRRGPNPRMVHPALSSGKHKEKDVCHINNTSNFQVFRSLTGFIVSLPCRSWLSNPRSISAIILRQLSKRVSIRSYHFLLSSCLLFFLLVSLISRDDELPAEDAGIQAFTA